MNPGFDVNAHIRSPRRANVQRQRSIANRSVIPQPGHNDQQEHLEVKIRENQPKMRFLYGFTCQARNPDLAVREGGSPPPRPDWAMLTEILLTLEISQGLEADRIVGEKSWIARDKS